MAQEAVEIPSTELRRGFATVAPVVAAILGLSLWAQLAMFSFRDELAADTSPARVLLYIVPFAVIGAGFWLRSAVLLLAVFPLSLLPPSVMIEHGGATFDGPWSAVQGCATMAIYLALVSSWLGAGAAAASVDIEDDVDPRVKASSRTTAGSEFRRFIYPRLVPLLLLWAVPTYAIFWDPAIAATIAQNHPERPEVAQIFIAMIVFFAWAIVAYMSFVVPSLNLEYDVRRLERSLDQIVAQAQPAAVWQRIGVAAGIAAAATLLILLIV